MTTIKSKKFAALLIALLLFCLKPCCAFAEGTGYKAVFSITLIDANNRIPNGTQFILNIEGDNSRYPLPSPSQLTVDKGGTFSFAPVEFTEPGNYSYTVRELMSDNQDVICDTKEYNIFVTVIRNDSGQLEGSYSLSLEQETEKPDVIVFTNDYRSDGNEVSSTASGEAPAETDPTQSGAESSTSSGASPSPGTGEPLSPAFFTLFISGALALLLFLINKRITINAPDEGDKAR